MNLEYHVEMIPSNSISIVIWEIKNLYALEEYPAKQKETK